MINTKFLQLIKLIMTEAVICITLEACGSKAEEPSKSIWQDIEGKSADSVQEGVDGTPADSIWEEIGEESTKSVDAEQTESFNDGQENQLDGNSDTPDGLAGTQSDDESGQDSSQADEEPIIVTPLTLKELVVSEAIVVDDTEEDLLASATGDEADYPNDVKDDEIPEFYVSDQVGGRDYVTPVRNQGYTALCWNYSALGAIESDLLRHHNDLNVNDLNLSEKHGAYYNMHSATGSALSGIDEDYREFVFDEEDEAWLREYDTNYISVGGVTDYCLSLYTAWKGPVADVDNNSFHVIKGQSEIYTQNADKPSGAYENTFCHVQGVYEIPATSKNRDLIKKLIMEHGSVTASICSEDALWTGKKVALYDYKKYGEGNYADHEILIVGWKDDYPAQNFITKPEGDGAFICKNSWGTGSGANGYFYLSYYDNVVSNNIVAAYDCAMPGDADWYDSNYQYAGFITHIMDPIDDQKNVVYMFDNNDARYAMRLSPEKDEVLSAVGYFSMTTGGTDQIAVYSLKDAGIHSDILNDSDVHSAINNMITDDSEDNNSEYGDEDSVEINTDDADTQMDYYVIEDLGEPLITMDCNYITGGYHTFPLNETIDIHSGEEYLIVVTPGKESKLIYEKEMDYMTDRHYDDWKHNLGRIHTHNTASGNSFLESAEGNAFISQNDKDFFIKAYTKN